MLNVFQRLCAETYGGGDFAHVERIDEAKDVGDTLFVFLMIELASSEGCDGPDEAVRRLDRAIVHLQDVAAAIEGG